MEPNSMREEIFREFRGGGLGAESGAQWEGPLDCTMFCGTTDFHIRRARVTRVVFTEVPPAELGWQGFTPCT